MPHLSWRGSRHSIAPGRPDMGHSTVGDARNIPSSMRGTGNGSSRGGAATLPPWRWLESVPAGEGIGVLNSTGRPKSRRALWRSAVLGTTIMGLLALDASPALAAQCPQNAKASFARVQLFKDANCAGGSVIVPKAGDGDRPNFAAFRDYDGSNRNVDKTRSSVVIDANTCVRFFAGVNYTGLQSTMICAGNNPLPWNLDGANFNDLASSMRVCRMSTQSACGDPAASAPPPARSPKPRLPKPPPDQPLPRFKKYLSAPSISRWLTATTNGSMQRVTWTVEVDGGVVVTRETPYVQTLAAGYAPPLGIEWQAPEIARTSITAIGDIRGPCGSVEASYVGIGAGVSGCAATLGRVTIKAKATKGDSITYTTTVSTTNPGRFTLGGSKFKWTRGIIH